jgi:phosphatidylserine/phosphatidylglycerophosphate/cardiolipin synthase-like enzyme
MTFNWDEASISCDNGSRNFMLVLDKEKKKDMQEIDDLIGIFNADWSNTDYKCKSKSILVGPGYNLDRQSQRNEIINLFLRAQKSIEIYTQTYNDDKISEVLEDIARHGAVKVRLIITPFPFGRKYDLSKWWLKLKMAGGEVHLWGPNGWPDTTSSDNTNLYIHAKTIIIDDKEAYIGSCNIYAPSLEIGRELGIITQDPNVINKLVTTFRKDWQLSDGWLEKQKNLQ